MRPAASNEESEEHTCSETSPPETKSQGRSKSSPPSVCFCTAGPCRHMYSVDDRVQCGLEFARLRKSCRRSHCAASSSLPPPPWCCSVNPSAGSQCAIEHLKHSGSSLAVTCGGRRRHLPQPSSSHCTHSSVVVPAAPASTRPALPPSAPCSVLWSVLREGEAGQATKIQPNSKVFARRSAKRAVPTAGISDENCPCETMPNSCFAISVFKPEGEPLFTLSILRSSSRYTHNAGGQSQQR
jgi:hypothetical protein